MSLIPGMNSLSNIGGKFQVIITSHKCVKLSKSFPINEQANEKCAEKKFCRGFGTCQYIIKAVEPVSVSH